MIRSTEPIRVAKVAVAILVLSAVVHGFSDGPPAGRTGAPGESTCVQCHTGALNTGPGSIAIEGVPAVYEPGETITVTVRLRHPDRRKWGFQLTAVDGQNKGAGTFALVDRVTTRLATGTGSLRDRTYVEQTEAGTFDGQRQEAVWQATWTAPPTDVGLVTFYAAGNAANGNNASSGDSIYTTAVVSGTAFPAIIAPKYKKGKILLQDNGSNVLGGATLEVTTAGAAAPEVFPLVKNKKGTKWLVKKSARSTPSGLSVDDLLPPGATVTLVVRNPDGTPSAPAQLGR